MDRLLGEHGLPEDTPATRREFERRMEARRAGEGDAAQWKGLRRGWCLGSGAFKKGLLERLHGQLGCNHAGALRQESEGARAEALVARELERLGWREEDLAQRPKGDAAKVALAVALRRETALTVAQIAQRLHMGSRNTVNNHLYEWRKSHEDPS